MTVASCTAAEVVAVAFAAGGFAGDGETEGIGGRDAIAEGVTTAESGAIAPGSAV